MFNISLSTMARSGTQNFNLTSVVRKKEPYAYAIIFSALEADKQMPEDDIKTVVWTMLRAVQGNPASVAKISVPDSATLTPIGHFSPFERWGVYMYPEDFDRIRQLEGTKPWAIYSSNDPATAKFGIRLHYPRAAGNPSWFGVVATLRNGLERELVFNCRYLLS